MYHFNLEALLQHRKFIEESKQKDFASIQFEFEQEKKHLQSLKKKQTDLATELRERQNQGLRPQEFFIYRTYTLRLYEEIETQQERVNEFEIKVNIARNHLLSAAKDRKTMETLKEKKKKEFMQRISKKEQTQINEAALIRFNRNSK